VKDLQRYLNSKKVNTKSCVEKKDLVELVIRENGDLSTSQQQSSTSVGSSAGAGYSAGAVARGQSRRDPIERQKSFPKAYTESTHRAEFLAKMEEEENNDVTSPEEDLVEDFVVVSTPTEEVIEDDEAKAEAQTSTTASSPAESPAVADSPEDDRVRPFSPPPQNEENVAESSAPYASTIPPPLPTAPSLRPPSEDATSKAQPSPAASPRKFANQVRRE